MSLFAFCASNLEHEKSLYMESPERDSYFYVVMLLLGKCLDQLSHRRCAIHALQNLPLKQFRLTVFTQWMGEEPMGPDGIAIVHYVPHRVQLKIRNSLERVMHFKTCHRE